MIVSYIVDTHVVLSVYITLNYFWCFIYEWYVNINAFLFVFD